MEEKNKKGKRESVSAMRPPGWPSWRRLLPGRCNRKLVRERAQLQQPTHPLVSGVVPMAGKDDVIRMRTETGQRQRLIVAFQTFRSDSHFGTTQVPI